MLLAIRDCFSIGRIGYCSRGVGFCLFWGRSLAGAVGSADGDVDVRQNGRYMVLY